MLVDSNIASQYLDPYCDTYGLSVVNGGTNTVISNNILTADTPPSQWGYCPSPRRYGYPIEVDGDHALIIGNTIQGFWSGGIALAGAIAVTVTGNTLCGSAGAQYIGWEMEVYPGAIIEDNTLGGCSAGSLLGHRPPGLPRPVKQFRL
jgi:hypothetical protein